MNMHKFDKDIWFLHRRLFHRFIKYAKYFRLATEELSVFQTATNEESIVSSKKRKREEEIQVISYDIHICYSHMLFTYAIHMVFLCQVQEHGVVDLFSSSSDAVSHDSEGGEDKDEGDGGSDDGEGGYEEGEGGTDDGQAGSDFEDVGEGGSDDEYVGEGDYDDDEEREGDSDDGDAGDDEQS